MSITSEFYIEPDMTSARKNPKKRGSSPKKSQSPKKRTKSAPKTVHTVRMTAEQQALEKSFRNMVQKPEAQRAKDQKAFQRTVLNILGVLKSRIVDEADLHDLFVAAPGSSKRLFSNYSLYKENKEEFTKRYLIEPLLKTLGYDDIAYQTAIGANGKKSDYILILDGDTRAGDRTVVVVEAKPMLEPLEKHREQIDYYLNRFNSKSLFTPYIGILTDGLTWELHALDESGKGIRYWRLNIQPILDWAFNKEDGQDPEFPVNTYRRFMTVFGRNNIQLYGNCLRYQVPFKMLDNNGKLVDMSTVLDEKPVKRKTRTNIHSERIFISCSRSL